MWTGASSGKPGKTGSVRKRLLQGCRREGSITECRRKCKLAGGESLKLSLRHVAELKLLANFFEPPREFFPPKSVTSLAKNDDRITR